MESSELNKIKIVVDDAQPYLYYNKYKYSFVVSLPLAGTTRYCSTEEDFNIMTQRRQNFIGIKRVKFEDFCNYRGASVDDLIKFVKFRNSKKSTCLVRMSFYSFSLYTNDLSDIQECISLFCNNTPITHVIRERHDIKKREKDIIYRVKPKRDYRVYLKTKRFENDEWNTFLDDLSAYSIIPNPSLTKRAHFVFDGDFLDFDNETTTMILMMKYPDLIKRICKLESSRYQKLEL